MSACAPVASQKSLKTHFDELKGDEKHGATLDFMEAVARQTHKQAGGSPEDLPKLYEDTHGKKLEEPTFATLPANGDVLTLLPPRTEDGQMVWQRHNVPNGTVPARSIKIVFRA